MTSTHLGLEAEHTLHSHMRVPGTRAIVTALHTLPAAHTRHIYGFVRDHLDADARIEHISARGMTIVRAECHTPSEAMRLHPDVLAQDYRLYQRWATASAPSNDVTWHSAAGRRMSVAILVSRTEHCLQALLQAHAALTLPCDIAFVAGNHAERATLCRQHGVPFIHVDHRHGQEAAEAELDALLQLHHVDLIVLARYMRVLTPGFVARHAGRIINIHHSLLPAFSGADPYRRAYARGVRYIGATAHYVTADLDEGPIIEQAMSRIASDDGPDALIAQGAALECQALVNATRWHLEHRVVTVGAATVVVSPTTIANTEAVS
ncbi:formyltetrahydrofolate deformylase [Ralstonia mojiangensis]|uniref:Formyltetrahydrofolate deformylase n=1 Tax=Ralstonia mojiangensis TaxID=2953895 RepID=A0ABT2LAP0_9RALS|nr:formyltetrahydrofolate deformylase [Ralstonia mojiangensis]MCO5414435.1 formyltetrahydrofolate deformylase [Ralstonia mojiangensis]MCT7298028.1 formyltetrahydrofolate deformylase [Ralstonia mojiangensis]MCT7312365.1 formyltetrahydrofolate deformylase [Ralstonia mojiangensis]